MGGVNRRSVGAAVWIALMIGLAVAPAASAYYPAQALELGVSVSPSGTSGLIQVSVANRVGSGIEGIYLESVVPPDLALQPDHGAVVGGVWRWVIERLGADESALARLAYQDLRPRSAPSVLLLSVRATGLAPIDIQASLPASPPAPALVALVGLLAFLAVAGAVAVRRPSAEHVFLVHRSGMLIGAKGRPLRDVDLFSGMLVILQEAIRRGLRDPVAQLKEMRFDGRTLALVHGKHALLAAVVRGEATPRRLRRAESILREFEAANGAALRDWNGDLAGLAGIEAALAGV